MQAGGNIPLFLIGGINNPAAHITMTGVYSASGPVSATKAYMAYNDQVDSGWGDSYSNATSLSAVGRTLPFRQQPPLSSSKSVYGTYDMSHNSKDIFNEGVSGTSLSGLGSIPVSVPTETSTTRNLSSTWFDPGLRGGGEAHYTVTGVGGTSEAYPFTNHAGMCDKGNHSKEGVIFSDCWGDGMPRHADVFFIHGNLVSDSQGPASAQWVTDGPSYSHGRTIFQNSNVATQGGGYRGSFFCSRWGTPASYFRAGYNNYISTRSIEPMYSTTRTIMGGTEPYNTYLSGGPDFHYTMWVRPMSAFDVSISHDPTYYYTAAWRKRAINTPLFSIGRGGPRGMSVSIINDELPEWVDLQRVSSLRVDNKLLSEYSDPINIWLTAEGHKKLTEHLLHPKSNTSGSLNTRPGWISEYVHSNIYTYTMSTPQHYSMVPTSIKTRTENSYGTYNTTRSSNHETEEFRFGSRNITPRAIITKAFIDHWNTQSVSGFSSIFSSTFNINDYLTNTPTSSSDTLVYGVSSGGSHITVEFEGRTIQEASQKIKSTEWCNIGIFFRPLAGESSHPLKHNTQSGIYLNGNLISLKDYFLDTSTGYGKGFLGNQLSNYSSFLNLHSNTGQQQSTVDRDWRHSVPTGEFSIGRSHIGLEENRHIATLSEPVSLSGQKIPVHNTLVSNITSTSWVDLSPCDHVVKDVNGGVARSTNKKVFSHGESSIKFEGHIDNRLDVTPSDASTTGTDTACLKFEAADDFSMEAWVYPTSAGYRGNMVFGKWSTTGTTDNSFVVSILSSGEIIGNFCNDPLDSTHAHRVGGTTNLFDDKWHHVLFQRIVSDDKIYLYVDGILENTIPFTGPLMESSIDFMIGDFADSIDGPASVWGTAGTYYTQTPKEYIGYLDDVRITKSIVVDDSGGTGTAGGLRIPPLSAHPHPPDQYTVFSMLARRDSAKQIFSSADEGTNRVYISGLLADQGDVDGTYSSKGTTFNDKPIYYRDAGGAVMYMASDNIWWIGDVPNNSSGWIYYVGVGVGTLSGTWHPVPYGAPVQDYWTHGGDLTPGSFAGPGPEVTDTYYYRNIDVASLGQPRSYQDTHPPGQTRPFNIGDLNEGKPTTSNNPGIADVTDTTDFSTLEISGETYYTDALNGTWVLSGECSGKPQWTRHTTAGGSTAMWLFFNDNDTYGAHQWQISTQSCDVSGSGTWITATASGDRGGNFPWEVNFRETADTGNLTIKFPASASNSTIYKWPSAGWSGGNIAYKFSTAGTQYINIGYIDSHELQDWDFAIDFWFYITEFRLSGKKSTVGGRDEYWSGLLSRKTSPPVYDAAGILQSGSFGYSGWVIAYNHYGQLMFDDTINDIKSADGVVTTGKWYHLTVQRTYDTLNNYDNYNYSGRLYKVAPQKTVTMFLDGVNIGSFDRTNYMNNYQDGLSIHHTPLMAQANTPRAGNTINNAFVGLRIGEFYIDSTGYNHTGYMDDIRIATGDHWLHQSTEFDKHVANMGEGVMTLTRFGGTVDPARSLCFGGGPNSPGHIVPTEYHKPNADTVFLLQSNATGTVEYSKDNLLISTPSHDLSQRNLDFTIHTGLDGGGSQPLYYMSNFVYFDEGDIYNLVKVGDYLYWWGWEEQHGLYYNSTVGDQWAFGKVTKIEDVGVEYQYKKVTMDDIVVAHRPYGTPTYIKTSTTMWHEGARMWRNHKMYLRQAGVGNGAYYGTRTDPTRSVEKDIKGGQKRADQKGIGTIIRTHPSMGLAWTERDDRHHSNNNDGNTFNVYYIEHPDGYGERVVLYGGRNASSSENSKGSVLKIITNTYDGGGTTGTIATEITQQVGDFNCIPGKGFSYPAGSKLYYLGPCELSDLDHQGYPTTMVDGTKIGEVYYGHNNITTTYLDTSNINDWNNFFRSFYSYTHGDTMRGQWQHDTNFTGDVGTHFTSSYYYTNALTATPDFDLSAGWGILRYGGYDHRQYDDAWEDAQLGNVGNMPPTSALGF